MPTTLLTNIGPQFVWKFFAAVTAPLGARILTIPAYHTQTSEQMEGFNRTVVDGFDTTLPSIRPTGTSMYIRWYTHTTLIYTDR